MDHALQQLIRKVCDDNDPAQIAVLRDYLGEHYPGIMAALAVVYFPGAQVRWDNPPGDIRAEMRALFRESAESVASGTIMPCRFVVGLTDNRFAQSRGRMHNQINRLYIQGVSHQGTRGPADLATARDGDACQAYGIGTIARLEVAERVEVGQPLYSDAEGRGIKTSEVDAMEAIAMHAGDSGDFVRVQVVCGPLARLMGRR